MPHFNYRTDVLSALVPHLSNMDSAAAPAVARAIGGAIRADLSGDVTLEALHMVAQLVKQDKCACHPEALAPFLEIRFDEGVLALEAGKKPETLSRKQTRKKRAEEREQWRKARAEKDKKKAEKERLKSFGHDPDDDSDEDDFEKSLERDMSEAAGRMDNAAKRKLQSKMLLATFEMYFRVLKNAASPVPAKRLPLMTPALIGLGKFTHLISVNFMEDLMEVFRKLLAGDALSADQKARTLLCACEILSGHGEALHVDTGEFHRQLYAMLAKPSDWTGGGDDDAKLDAGALRIKTLQRFLAGYKQVDQNRVAAFAKRLAGTALASEAGEAVGALGVARQLLAAYPKTRCLLENEKVGVGAFDPNLDDPETCVGLAAVLWDLSLLRSHYHPAVAAAASEVAGMPLQGAVATALGSHAPAELARLHSTTRGTFRPAIPPPRVGKKAKTSPLDRASGKGGKRGERAVLDLGPELRALVEGTAHDENANAKGSGGGGGGGGADEAVVDALRRHFLETKAFAVNGELRKEATRLRRMTQKAKAHAHERAAAAAAAAAAAKKKKKETSAAGGKKRSKAAKAA